jgi:hypothetical protein
MTPAESAQRMAVIEAWAAQNPGLHGHLAWRNLTCMPIRMTHALIISVALLATGCSRLMDPDIKQNPHPVKRYEITMTIDGAPGPFELIEGHMQFVISNPLCAPQDLVSGARPTPIERPPITLTRVNDRLYKGTIYLDLLQDEDYYGLGVCQWKMVASIMSLQAHDVSMGADISYDDIVAQRTVTQYMAKELYHGSAVKDLNVGAGPISDYIAKNRDKFFSITIKARENAP